MSQELNLSEEDYRTLAEMYMEEVEQRFRRRRPFVSSAGIRLRIMRDQDCSRKTAGEVVYLIGSHNQRRLRGMGYEFKKNEGDFLMEDKTLSVIYGRS